MRDVKVTRLTPTPEQQRGTVTHVAGDAIEVLWEPRLCVHMRDLCGRLPRCSFREETALDDVDAADADAVRDCDGGSCPTGALHYRHLDGGREEQQPAERASGPTSTARSSSAAPFASSTRMAT